MILNDLQTDKLKRYLKKSNIDNSSVCNDFLDHLCCIVEELMDKGCTFEDAFEKAIIILPESELKSTEQYTLKLLNMETTFSSRTALQATIPFALFGLYWPFSNSSLNVPGIIQEFLLLSFVVSMFVLLCIGWVKNFPRWSFPAIGFCLLFSGFFMNVSIPGISEGILGLWAWIPLLILIIVSQILKPGIEPVRNISKKVKEEPFLILFAFYGFTPFLLLVFSDEIHTNWMIPFTLLMTTIISLGNYLFLKCGKRLHRVVSIIVAGVISISVTIFAAIVFPKVCICQIHMIASLQN